MSLVVICEILGLFANTFNADDKYCIRNFENLPQPIQIQLSKKQKKFSQLCAKFLKSDSNFEHFEKKDDPESLCISEIRNCERRG